MSHVPPTLKAKVYIYAKYDYDFESNSPRMQWGLDFWRIKVEDEKDRIFLETREVEVDTSNFNPIPKQLEALKEEKRQATADFVKRTAEINDQISKLLAIENGVATAQAPSPSDNDFSL